MSTTSNITPFITNNNKCNTENNLSSFESFYDSNSIDSFALRKQLSRAIPNCYVKVTNQIIKKKGSRIDNTEEYNKLKEEIIRMKESIELLKESKNKKLHEIEELRIQMRKAANKEIITANNNNNNKNKIPEKKSNNFKSIIFNNGYCAKEKTNKSNSFNNCVSTGEESDSLSLGGASTSGLSSGKDEEAASDDKDPRGGMEDNQRCCFILGKKEGGSISRKKELEPIEDESLQ